MKFPSIKSLAEGFKTTLALYPLEVAFALIGTIAATVNVELDNINRVGESWCVRIMMTANLGLLLSLAITLYTRSRNPSALTKWGLRGTAVVLAILICTLIDPYYRQSDYMRFFLLSLSFHLLVAYAGFTISGHIQGFWQFNKTLFLRFLTSVLYSGVLYLGLAAAIGALNFLFNFKFEWDTFLILWIWIAGMFNTLFFLAGVPVDLSTLDQDDSYPKGLKVFTQYVLVPLATVYVLILLAYEVKILLQWSLPKGYVSNIILGYAVFGILSLLLVYPIREREENKWLKTYARSFYFLMLPLLALLFVAVGTRVFKYGITEERYFLIVLAFWLLFISVYFLLFKKQNIKLIPVSLSILTLLSVYGPQSAFSVSKYSQTRILVNIFKKHNSFNDGKLKPLTTKIDSTSGAEAASKVEYLVREHDFASLQPYISRNLDLIGDSITKGKERNIYFNRYEFKYLKTEWMIKYLKLNKYYGRYGFADTVVTMGGYYSFESESDVVDLKEYDYMLTGLGADSTVLKVNNLSLKRTEKLNGKIIGLLVNGQRFEFDINQFEKQLSEVKTKPDAQKYNPGDADKIPLATMIIIKQINGFKVALVVTSISFNMDNKALDDNLNINGYYLIKELR
ncbi:DUF4153 domain-containing protein [Mucilaginibacter sp. HD30]